MKKTLFIVALSIIASSYCFADDVLTGYAAKRDENLQQKAYSPSADYAFKAGDTIVISKSMTKYLTGETPSEWVYFVRHTIQQVGGKRFPQGILIRGIFSWVGPDDLLLYRAVEENEQAEQRQKEDKPAVIERQEEMGQKTQEERDEIARKAARVGATPLEPIVKDTVKEEEPKEPVVAVVDTVAKQEQVAEQKPEQKPEPVVADTIAEQPVTDTVAEEQPAAQQDTTASDSARYKGIDRFTIGVRGGVASLMQQTVNNTAKNFGFDALLDIQYAHYWITKKEHRVGLLLGVSAGYGQGGLHNGVDDSYTRTSPEGESIQYDVKTEDIKETDRQIQLEVPLMFSLITKKGFFLNLGPRFMLPLYTPYSETLVKPEIKATFPWGVVVPDEIATGKVTQLDYNGKSAQSMKVNVMLGVELGYEWFFKSGNSLGLGAYANYSVYSMFKQQTQNKGLIDVTPAAPTIVDVYSATDTYTSKMGYLDAGVKLAYHFNWWKK